MAEAPLPEEASTANEALMRQFANSAMSRKLRERGPGPLPGFMEGLAGEDELSGSVMDPGRASSRAGYDLGKVASITTDLPGPGMIAGAGKTALAAAPLLARKLAPKVAAPAARKAVEGALVNLKLREMAPREAVEAAARGEHLRKRPSELTDTEGLYYGGPRNVTSPAKLGGNRQRMDYELGNAAQEIEKHLGAEKVGDWYPSQRRGVERVAEPYQQRRLAQAEGLFSPQASPEGEFGFSLTAHNRLAREEPVGIVRTGQQGDEFAASAAEGRDIKLGEKTGIYAQLSDPSQPPSIFGTNDFRQAQFMGYTDPTGAPQTTGMKPSQHAFMDAETLALSQRANAKKLGGREDWTGPMAQEVPWVIEKGNAMQANFPGRFPKTPEGRRAALEEASKTIEAHIPKHSGAATYEYVPGGSTGHAPVAGKSADYGDIGAWRDPKTGRDEIYSGARMLQSPTTEGRGVYTNAAGQTEFNPVNIAQPMVDFGEREGVGRAVSAETAKQLSLAEHLRGAVDAQEASAWHIPLSQATRKAGSKTHALLEGAALGDNEMRSVVEALPPGWSASASPRGTMLMNFGEGGSKEAAQAIQAMQPKIAAAAPGAKPLERVGMDSDLIDIYARGGQPTPAGQGIVTSELLQRAAQSPPGVARNLSESEGIRAKIRAKTLRDEKLAAGGEPIREDIQRLRRFLSEADWAKAADLIRKGMTPAAAVSALGYSLSGMAAEEAR